MKNKKINVLRPVRETPLVSARVFEELFTRHLADVLEIHPVPLVEFCDRILGHWENSADLDRAAKNFQRCTRDYDFFCPSYECIPLAPLFLRLRNMCRADIRLLFIAHSAGAYALEWVMMLPLLVRGDIVAAPSQCARETILWLCPELSPYVKVLHHPIAPLPRAKGSPRGKNRDIRLVTLGRLTPSKLIHRQVEAVDILRKQGLKNIRMHIAGSLEDPRTGELTGYARSLKAKIKRLKLDNHVFLEGNIDGEKEKSAFLADAHMSLNLSKSIEESFPKASIEPLGLGIPVIACRWNGFVETVGDCGKLIPLTEIADGFLDVMPEHIADSVHELLEHPVPPEQCMTRAGMYLPAEAKKNYLDVLSRAMQFQPSREITHSAPAVYQGKLTDTAGLMGKIACLKPFSRQEIMDFHLDYSQRVRASWLNCNIENGYHEDMLRGMVLLSLYIPLSYFYAGKGLTPWIETTGSPSAEIDNRRDFWPRIAAAVGANAIITSKTACLHTLAQNNMPGLLEKSLALLEIDRLPPPARAYYRSEVYYRKQDYASAYEIHARQNRSQLMTCYDSLYLEQIAAICREWKKPGLALPRLQAWLGKYPDEPDSGTVWFNYLLNRLQHEKTKDADITDIFNHVKQLSSNPDQAARVEQIMRLSHGFA